jgi:hypothetical protein
MIDAFILLSKASRRDQALQVLEGFLAESWLEEQWKIRCGTILQFQDQKP